MGFEETDLLLESTLLEAKLNESYIINKDNKVFNLEKFPKEHNILFITGLSGSGKSTIAATKASYYDAISIELDYFSYKTDHPNEEDPYRNSQDDIRGYDIVDQYIKEKKPKNDDSIKLIIWLMRKFPDKRFIVEGIQIYYIENWKSIKDYPVLIIMKSTLQSAWNAHKREVNSNDATTKDKLKSLSRFIDPKFIKWYIEETKRLERFIKFMESE